MSKVFGGGGGSSGGTTQTTVQNADPWSGQQPYLTQVFGEAKNLYEQGLLSPSTMAGSQIAPFSSETQKAMELQTQRALSGSQLLTSAQRELSKTIGGEYLQQGNPYLEAVMGNVERQVTPAVASQFAGSGRYGSGSHARAAADALASAGAQAGLQQYGDERTRQMQAMMFAPQMAQSDYQDAAALSEIGAKREEMAQAQLTEQQQKYNQEQMKRALALQNYQNLIQGNYGGTTTSTTPVAGRDVLGQTLGAATSAAGLGSMLGMGTAGMSGMAGLGGLLGLFSDKRLKTNIKKIGKHRNGLNIYSFNYIWGGDKETGFMADEVRKKNPDAVFNVNGFYAVDYLKAVQ